MAVLFVLAVRALPFSSPAAMTGPVKVEQGSLAGTNGSSPDIRVYHRRISVFGFLVHPR